MSAEANSTEKIDAAVITEVVPTSTHGGAPMGSDTRSGELPAIPEDTLDLGDRLDPVRTLLRRAAIGDRAAAGALLDVLGPRIHGLGVHVTGSSAKAGKLTVWVLRSCLRDAAQLAASGLPGEAAVLDRARRAAVATEPSGDVRSLVAPDGSHDRTRDRREVTVMRALLDLAPRERALVESAAQGRFPVTGGQRVEAATVLARVLDRLVPFGGSAVDGSSPTAALAALDALALADDTERSRLRELTAGVEGAVLHRHAIEAAAQLTLLTAVPPSRDLHEAVLEGFGPPAPAGAVQGAPLRDAGAATGAPGQQAPATSGPEGSGAPSAAPGPEAAYRGTYATPVLGTDSQRRMVGPPAMAGGAPGVAGAVPVLPAAATVAPSAAPGTQTPLPAFAFDPAEQAALTRQAQRRARKDPRARGRAQSREGRGVPWVSRTLAALGLISALVLGYGLYDARQDLHEARAFADTWTRLSMETDATMVPGLSDNGTWRAVFTDDEVALWADGVTGYCGQDEVLQLWGERDGLPVDLGVLELHRDGSIRHSVPEGVESLKVTREHEPRNQSGTPSDRVVATLSPEVSGI